MNGRSPSTATAAASRSVTSMRSVAGSLRVTCAELSHGSLRSFSSAARVSNENRFVPIVTPASARTSSTEKRLAPSSSTFWIAKRVVVSA